MSLRKLKGQVALVTGGGRGIGQQIALTLASAGASVAICARTEAQLEETVESIKLARGKSQAFKVDVTDAEAIASQVANVEGSLGPVDLLVNNAGTVGPIGPLWESDMHQWWHTMDVNFRGPALTARAVLPGMIKRRRGRIVNIVSSSYPFPYLSAYMSSKTALIRLSEIIAAETRAHGISVFSLAPGTVRTALSERSLHSEEGQKWLPWFQRVFDEGLDIPAENAAQFVVELALGRADSLSGRFLSVSDDLDAIVRQATLVEKQNLYSLSSQRLETASVESAGVAAFRDSSSKRYELHISHTIPAPRDRVFRAWTDSELVKKWFVHGAPVHWNQGASPIIDARQGGGFVWSVVSDDNALKVFEFRGTYQKVEAPATLSFTWQWEALPIDGIERPGKTLVTARFIEEACATRIVLTQVGFLCEAARDAHAKGWARCLDGMKEMFRVIVDGP